MWQEHNFNIRRIEKTFRRHDSSVQYTYLGCYFFVFPRRSKVTSILLENPTNQSFTLQPRITNPDVFALHWGASAQQLASVSAQLTTDCEVRSRVRSRGSPTRFDWDIQLPTAHRTPDDQAPSDPSVSGSQSVMVKLAPKSRVRLGLKFTPHALGELEHDGQIEFVSDEASLSLSRSLASSLGFALSVWLFKLRGCGLPPEPRDPVYTSVEIGSAVTLTLSMINPFRHPVLCDIYLTPVSYSALLKRVECAHSTALSSHPEDTKQPASDENADEQGSPENSRGFESMDLNKPLESAFQLLVRREKGVRVEAKAVFDIPLTFAPMEMREHEAVCCAVMRRVDGQSLGRGIESGEEIHELRWLTPIKGVPEATSQFTDFQEIGALGRTSLPRPIIMPTGSNRPALISGVARTVSRFHIELNLSANVPLTKSQQPFSSDMLSEDRPSQILIRPVSSTRSGPISARSRLRSSPSEWVGTSSWWTRAESGDVSWKLEAVTREQDRELAELINLDQLLRKSINIHLITLKKEKPTGPIELVLGVIFTPSRPFKYVRLTWMFLTDTYL
ncbi:unnamed protein product [Echinostoma caproni]|uniref:TRAPP trafficking subunit Trs65-domain-containing protein n=1 Tax=Echinostoma caproni TaxID=27848 RepID=A0A183B613_9TREM|nr:unnamed protein product [Echinostoma caproni]